MQTYTRNYSYHDRSHFRNPKKNSWLKSKRLLLVVILVLAALGAKVAFSADNRQAPEAGQAGIFMEKQEEEKKPEPPKPKIVDTANLKASIDQINAKYPYDISVAIVELNSGELIQAGDTSPYLAASTTKLLTALYYFNEVEAGQESLAKNIAGKTASEQMRLMINRSDNPAWYRLNEYLGYAKLEEFAHRQGLTSFDSIKNTMATGDMARLMEKIHKRELINNEHTALLYSWMQKTSEERFIPPAIPAGTPFYHKAGYLPDRAHDVAIIENGETPFGLVIFSKSPTSNYDFVLGQKIFKEITSATVNTFNQQ